MLFQAWGIVFIDRPVGLLNALVKPLLSACSRNRIKYVFYYSGGVYSPDAM